MKEIRVLKDFYIFRFTGAITTKKTIYCVNDGGEKTLESTFIQKEETAKLYFDLLKEYYPNAKVRYADRTKDSKNIHKFKVLSEDRIKELND